MPALCSWGKGLHEAPGGGVPAELLAWARGWEPLIDPQTQRRLHAPAYMHKPSVSARVLSDRGTPREKPAPRSGMAQNPGLPPHILLPFRNDVSGGVLENSECAPLVSTERAGGTFLPLFGTKLVNGSDRCPGTLLACLLVGGGMLWEGPGRLPGKGKGATLSQRQARAFLGVTPGAELSPYPVPPHLDPARAGYG